MEYIVVGLALWLVVGFALAVVVGKAMRAAEDHERTDRNWRLAHLEGSHTSSRAR